MIETYNLPRGLGKTTKVIEMMRNDADLFCIIPFYSQKNYYPKELHNRIICGNMDLFTQIAGKKVLKVVLDEGFAYKKDMLAKLYYELGNRNIDVVSLGTI